MSRPPTALPAWFEQAPETAHWLEGHDWRARGARQHPWKQAPPAVFRSACEELASILEI